MQISQEIIDGNMLNPPPIVRGSQTTAIGPKVAQTLYAGLFEEGAGEYYLWVTSDYQNLLAKWHQLAQVNLRLVDIDTFVQGNTAVYAGVWVQRTDGFALLKTADWDAFYKFWQDNINTLKLVDIDIKDEGAARYFTGIWLGQPTEQVLVHDLAWNDFTERWNTLSSEQSLRLTKIIAYPSADTTHFTGIFEPGNDAYALLYTTDWNQFYNYYTQEQDHLQLVDFHVYDNDGLRWYIGVWRETAAQHHFVYGLDWASFTNTWNQLSSKGLRLKEIEVYSNAVEGPTPQWDQIFQAALGSSAEGYAYAVARSGQVVSKGIHFTRSPYEPVNPSTSWAAAARINLASVSKPITAVALLALVENGTVSIDKPFHPYIATKVPTVGSGVDTVTIKNLLTMKSGLVEDGALTGDLWPYLTTYLQQGLVGTPGQTSVYSNANFTILQAIIEEVTGQNYVDYVTQALLVPMGINPAIFNSTPDPAATATLFYSDATDTRPGGYWGPFDFVGAGGWIASAEELLKFLIGVRNHTVLMPQTTDLMLRENLGWYTWNGVYGQYFNHNGWLFNGAQPPQQLFTGVMHLTNGYDAVLLINSPGDVIDLIAQAFEAS